MNSFLQYLKDSYQELTTKVTWLSWTELQSSTITVLVGVFLLSVVLASIDYLISHGVSGIFNILN